MSDGEEIVNEYQKGGRERRHWDDRARAREIARKRGEPILRKREIGRKASWIKINGYGKKDRGHIHNSLSNLVLSVGKSILNSHQPLARQEELVSVEPCNPSFPQ